MEFGPEAVVVTPDTPLRREQIVRAATVVLGRQGYADASLKQIAREAGVAPGLLHYYFESKEDLLLEVVDARQRDIEADRIATVGGIDDPLERIVASLDRAAQIAVERPESIRLLFDLHSLGQRNDTMRVRMQELRTRRLDNIEAELRAVFGQLPAYTVVPPRQIAEAVTGAIDGIAMIRLVEQRDCRLAYHALKALLLSMIVTAYVATAQKPPMARLQALLDRGVPEMHGTPH